jgi:hypothetical protein
MAFVLPEWRTDGELEEFASVGSFPLLGRDRRKLAHVSTRIIRMLDLCAPTQQNARAMAYVVHFLPIEPGEDWLEALEAQEREQARRREREGDQLVDIVRPDWWRIAALAKRLLSEFELRRTRRGLTIVDRVTGIVLDLEQDEIGLALPYRLDEDLARESLILAQRIAAFVEGETGLVAFDPQLGQPFVGVDGAVDQGAALIASTRRAMANRMGERRRHARDEQRPLMR